MSPRKRNPKITEKDRPKKIRAVYYVRQSTEGQDDLLSPESQIRKIKAFAEREGIEMVGGYEDIAISGSSAENRAGFQRMIGNGTSSKNPFEMIIVYDISRFTRKTKDLLNYRDLLKEHGVRIQSVTEPHNGDAASDEAWVHTSAGNESMLSTTAKKTRDSQFEALERGYHPGGPASFGFKTEDVVVKTRRLTPGGRERERETVHSKLVPDWGGEADWVKKMYEMNNEGHSTAAVAHYLREQGVKTRFGIGFTPGSVGYILRNPRNAGKQERGQQSVSEYLPQDEIATKEEAHEPIVLPGVWDKAQEMLESRRPKSSSRESGSGSRESGSGSRESGSPRESGSGSPEGKSGSPRSNCSPSRFSGLTECGDCGSPTNLAAERILVCSQRKIRVAYCPNSHREKLDEVQLPAVKILIEDLIDEEFLNEHFDHVVELNKVILKEHEKRESVIDRTIKDVKGNIKSLTDITEDPTHEDRNVDELLDRLDERRAELKQLEKDKKNLATESDGLMAYVNDRERIIKNALDMRTIIETAEPQIANQFIKLFVEKLVIKDHIGTIHFKVPSLGEGPYRPPESFKVGEYPGPIPNPFESEKYPFERRTGGEQRAARRFA